MVLENAGYFHIPHTGKHPFYKNAFEHAAPPALGLVLASWLALNLQTKKKELLWGQLKRTLETFNVQSLTKPQKICPIGRRQFSPQTLMSWGHFNLNQIGM